MFDLFNSVSVDEDLFEWADAIVDDENIDDDDLNGFDDFIKFFRSSLITRLISGILASSNRFILESKFNFESDFMFESLPGRLCISMKDYFGKTNWFRELFFIINRINFDNLHRNKN